MLKFSQLKIFMTEKQIIQDGSKASYWHSLVSPNSIKPLQSMKEKIQNHEGTRKSAHNAADHTGCIKTHKTHEEVTLKKKE